MGYSEATLRQDAKIAGAAFVPVSGTVNDLTEMRPTGYDPYDPVEDEGGAFGEVYIQILNSYGKDIATYSWYDMEDEGTPYRGWFKDDDLEQPLNAGEVKLAPGEGILTKSSDDGYGLQSSGQVLTDKDMPVLLRQDAKMVANITPVDVDLINCYVLGYDPYDPVEDEGGAFGEVYIQVLNSYGKDIATYSWYDMQDEGTPYCGWYKDDDLEQPLAKGAVVMGPGQGILTKSADDGYSFVFPKVDVK